VDEIYLRAIVILRQPVLRAEVTSAVLTSEGQEGFAAAFLAFHSARLFRLTVMPILYVSPETMRKTCFGGVTNV
jgi:hypothetical protein